MIWYPSFRRNTMKYALAEFSRKIFMQVSPQFYFVESFGLLGTLMSKNIIWNVLQEDVIRFCVIYEVHKDCVTPNPTYIHRYWRSCKYLCSIFSFPCPYFFCNLPQMFVDKLVFHQTRIASNTWYFMYLILVYLEIRYLVNTINLYLDTCSTNPHFFRSIIVLPLHPYQTKEIT